MRAGCITTITYPTPLETVLGTEEAVRSMLQTGWTLQIPCIIGAVNADALFRRNFGGHRVDGGTIGIAKTKDPSTQAPAQFPTK